MFHVKVFSTFLRAGVQIGSVRELLEENGCHLTDRRNMYDLIPFIQKHEFDIIFNELKGKDLSVIFDGTTRLGEALGIVRFVDDEWKINQR